MLKKLTVHNYAIIKEVELDFHQGLSIITGETGAGKSIIMGALGLIMGNRADTKTLFNPEKKCIIEGVFLLSGKNFQPFFLENDIDWEEETIIRREITPSGKSRAFINDTPVNLRVLKRLTSLLVDLHQQFDNLDIHHVSFQLKVLDALADNSELLEQYREIYARYAKDKKELERLRKANADAVQEFDFLQFQLDEFDRAELQEGEQEGLEEEIKRLTHAEDIKTTLGGLALEIRESETNLSDRLRELTNALNPIEKFHQDIPNLKQKLESLTFDLEDLGDQMENIAETTEYNPERILEVRGRLDTVYHLQNKYQVGSVEDLLRIQAELTARMDDISDLSGKIEVLEQAIAKTEGKLLKQSEVLGKRRRKVIPAFERKIAESLSHLSMPHARLSVQAEYSDTLLPTGKDEIEFLFSANKGGRPESIKDVASGGELSRLTLCIKSLIAGALAMPTMIFDEIDTGISGDVALKMGYILAKLSGQHQVISITHTPQIAIRADRHFFVYKSDDGQRTTTKVKVLEQKERIVEIATMLSGAPPSSSAIENARELLTTTS